MTNPGMLGKDKTEEAGSSHTTNKSIPVGSYLKFLRELIEGFEMGNIQLNLS